jgi:hypothetical protein
MNTAQGLTKPTLSRPQMMLAAPANRLAPTDVIIMEFTPRRHSLGQAIESFTALALLACIRIWIKFVHTGVWLSIGVRRTESFLRRTWANSSAAIRCRRIRPIASSFCPGIRRTSAGQNPVVCHPGNGDVSNTWVPGEQTD